MKCFFAGRPGWGPCDGPLIRAHLIPKQTIKREVFSALLERGVSKPEARLAIPACAMDERSWVPCCGGLTGIGGHHAELDSAVSTAPRLRRDELPVAVEGYAAELDELVGREVFASLLDRLYGTRG